MRNPLTWELIRSAVGRSIAGRRFYLGLVYITLLAANSACVTKTAPNVEQAAISSPELATLEAKIKFWEARITRDPEDPTAAQRLAAAHIRRARLTGDFSSYIKAEKALSQALEIQPNNYETLTLLAAAKAAQHKFREAVAMAESASQIMPHEEIAYAILFDCKLELGDLEGADLALRKVKELAPGFMHDTRAASLSLIKGDKTAALASLGAALDEALSRNFSSQDLVWLYVRIGAIHFDHGEQEMAERNYQTALQLYPDSYLALEHLAELRAEQGRYNEAIALYNKVIELSPAPEFFEALGEIYKEQGQGMEAEKWLTLAENEALQQVEHGDIGAYRFLAKFYSDTRPQVEKALKFARADLEVRSDIHTYDTFAWALHKASKEHDAKAAINRALATGTKEASILCHAAAIYSASGEYARANELSCMAMDSNPLLKEEPCRSSCVTA